MTMSKGRFGSHGGQYIPETLMNAVIELEEAYDRYKADPEFNAELDKLLTEYAGRPSRLYFASIVRVMAAPILYINNHSAPLPRALANLPLAFTLPFSFWFSLPLSL